MRIIVKKSGFIAMSLIVLLLGCGCGKEVYSYSSQSVRNNNDLEQDDMNDIKQAAKDALDNKYFESFTIDSIEKLSEGGAFYTYYYSGKANCTSKGITFNFRIEEDKESLKDNYEGYMYSDQIEKDLKDASEQSGIERTEFSVGYSVSDSVYGSFDEYKKSGLAYLKAKYRVTAADSTEAADKTFKLVDSIQNSGYGFSISLKWDSKTIVLSHGIRDEDITLTDIEKKFNL